MAIDVERTPWIEGVNEIAVAVRPVRLDHSNRQRPRADIGHHLPTNGLVARRLVDHEGTTGDLVRCGRALE